MEKHSSEINKNILKKCSLFLSSILLLGLILTISTSFADTTASNLSYKNQTFGINISTVSAESLSSKQFQTDSAGTEPNKKTGVLAVALTMLTTFVASIAKYLLPILK